MEITRELLLRTKHLDRPDLDFNGGQSEKDQVEAFQLGNEMLSSNPDGGPIELTPRYIHDNVDLDKLRELYGEQLVMRMNENLRSGMLADPDVINEVHRRMNEIVAERLGFKGPERMVWFTFRRDGKFNYVDWPVAEYVGHDRRDIWYLSWVEKALTRLKRNRTITNISVTGVIPKHWYQVAL